VTGYTGAQLHEDLERLGLTRRDLEALTGVQRSGVSKWINGRAPVPTYVRTIIRQTDQIRTLVLRSLENGP
jgi:transcriptional regulator with XRE-family HTH domain